MESFAERTAEPLDKMKNSDLWVKKPSIEGRVIDSRGGGLRE